MKVAENLRRLRLASGMSQARLAEVANVSQQLVSQIEGGKNFSTKYLPQIARALNAKVGDLDPSYQQENDPLDDPVTRELAKLAQKLGEAERRLLLAAAQGLLAQDRGEG